MIGRPSPGHTARRVLIRSMLAMLVLVSLVWIVVTGGIGMGVVVPWALARAAPEGWTVSVQSVEGEWHRRIHVQGLAMEGPDGTLRAEAVLLEFRLPPLLRRTIDVRRVHVSKPVYEGSLSRGTSSEVPADTAGARSAVERLLSDAPLGDWDLRIAELRVDDAEAVLEGSGGSYRIEGADLAGSTRLAPEITSITVDSLAVEGIPPPTGAEPAEWATDDGGSGAEGADRKVWLRLAARLEDGLLEVGSLRLWSARSHVTGAGNLLVAPVAGYVDSVAFDLQADPLDLRDLPVELPPALLEAPELTVRLTATGPPEAVSLALEADGPGSLTARADGILRAISGATPREHAASSALELDTRLSVDLREWVAPPWAGQLDADVEIGLGELDPAAELRVAGTIFHSPPADAPAGILGSPLRVDVDATRAARHADTAAAGIEATAVLYRPPQRPPSIQAVPRETDWVEMGELAAQVDGSRSTWQIDLLLDSGSLEGTGAVSWEEGAREVVVEGLRVQRLDLSAFAPNLPVTSIDARLGGRVAGSSITELAGRVVLAVDSSTYGESVIDTASVAADLVAGSITGSAMVEADAGHVESEYRVLLDESLIEAHVTRFEGVAPADPAVAEDTLPAWRALGSATVTWARGEMRRATLSASLDTA